MEDVTVTYGKKFFQKSADYRPLKASLEKRVGKEKAAQIFDAAGEELDRIMAEFPDVPKGERQHTDKFIFPRAAMYRVLKSEFGGDAAGMIDELIRIQGEKMGGMLRRITALPLMERVFLKIFTWMTKAMFGEKNGFRQNFYESPEGTVRFDILDCPYCRYCRLCGCPELIHTFCDSDAYCFGSLSKIAFTREETLETGKKCDFTLTVTK